MKNDIPKLAVISKCFVKTRTNNDELCKQYFALIIGDDHPEELVLSIRKLVLSSEIWLYRDMEILREFNGKTLYQQRFSIKTSTFEKAQKLLEKNSTFK